MLVSELIERIYKEVPDSSYIIRFLDYLVYSSNIRVTFIIKEYSAEPLISGILQNVKTKERYSSLAEFYNKASLENIAKTDTSIFKKIHLKSGNTLWNLISNTQEKTVLNFFDQKYRSFLTFRNIRQRIKLFKTIDISKEINLFWNEHTFISTRSQTICDKNPNMIYSLLQQYEDKSITGLYYCCGKDRYLITDSQQS